MRKNLILASLLTVSSSVMAMDVDYFVGAGAGGASWTPKINIKAPGVSASETNNDSGAFASIQGGVILDKSHKIGLDYSYYNTSGDNSMYSFSLGYDYLFNINNSDFKPFVGLAYTMAKYSEDLKNRDGVVFDSSSIDLTTNALFARVGVQYDFDKNFFVLASYDHALTISGDESVGFTYGGAKGTATIETDKLSRFGAYVGYKF